MSYTVVKIPYKLTVIPSRIIIGDMEYVSVDEAAEITGYVSAYIRHLLRQKKIEAQKKGNMWWIELDSLKKYKEEMDALGNDKYFQWRESNK